MSVVKSEPGEFPKLNPQLEDRKLPSIPISSPRSSFPPLKMPYMAAHSTCDSISSNLMPPPHDLSNKKQIYDNPRILKLEQPSSSDNSIQSSVESQSLMPPPKCLPSARDLSIKKTLSTSSLLESQLMPPPKVIPGGLGVHHQGDGRVTGMAGSDMVTPSTSSSSRPGRANHSGHDKEEIGKTATFPQNHTQ